MSSVWLSQRSRERVRRLPWRGNIANHEPRPTTLEGPANIATIVASVVATMALIFGYVPFHETQLLTRKAMELQVSALEHEREAKAIDLFLKFNEIQQAIASPSRKTKGEVLFWQQNIALTTTESVFKLTQGDAGWMATVAFMLQEQRDFLKKNGLQCATFLPAFVEFVTKEMGEDVCR
jgi:hypothetical protein